MSDDINPTTSPTLTDLLQGGEDKTEQQGFNLAALRLKTFNQMVQQASAYQVVLKQEGSITEEECTSIIQGYNHIQTELTQADNSFCCEECGQGSPYLFSNDDGLCSWCCESLDTLGRHGVTRSAVSSGQNPENDDEFKNLPMGVHNCCDWHTQAESTKEQPCAMYQGNNKYAPNFDNDGDEYDAENTLFLSHVEHLIENGEYHPAHILELLEGWVDLSCPACSATLEFSRDGDGCRADCFHCEVGSSLNVVIL
tara:strand:- start:24 stop:785 length:762 start_codon:yes stop_codon:yes gene_type:complete